MFFNYTWLINILTIFFLIKIRLRLFPNLFLIIILIKWTTIPIFTLFSDFNTRIWSTCLSWRAHMSLIRIVLNTARRYHTRVISVLFIVLFYLTVVSTVISILASTFLWWLIIKFECGIPECVGKFRRSDTHFLNYVKLKVF